MALDLLKEKSRIEEFLNKSPHQLSVFSFVNIFLWKDFFRFTLDEINGNLCVFAEDSVGCFLYLPPLGERVSREVLTECFRRMNVKNKNPGVSRVENMETDDTELLPSPAFRFFKKSDEYIYRAKDIVSLKGNLFKSKRSSYNQFIKHYDYEFLPYIDSMKDECLALYRAWKKGKFKSNNDANVRQMLEENETVHHLALTHAKILELAGYIVRIAGRIVAYSFGYALNKTTFCILFEITDLNVKGLSVFIFREFCAELVKQKVSLINVMDDFNLENIKKVKLSFRPHAVIPCFNMSQKVSRHE